MIVRRNLQAMRISFALALGLVLISEFHTTTEALLHSPHGISSSIASSPAFVAPPQRTSRALSLATFSLQSKFRPCDDENFFLNQIETTIANVLQHQDDDTEIKDLPIDRREAVGVARNLKDRLSTLRKSNDCPRCWLQRAHCICDTCHAVDRENDPYPHLQRIFLVMHHKEIAMKIDTAKLILSAFPSKCRLVVAGIGAEHQPSMQEMEEAIHQQTNDDKTSLLLFPDDNARTLQDIVSDIRQQPSQQPLDNDKAYDLIVLDGTWSQARKFVSKYFLDKSSGDLVPNVQAVKLSEEAVDILGSEGSTESGHQLRRHCTSWRQVGTFEATRLFLRDWSQGWDSPDENNEAVPAWTQIEAYQKVANDAAIREIGPLRKSKKESSKV